MTQRPTVVAWFTADPSVRVMARATAESAVRGAELQVLSPTLPPGQWPSWRAAAASQGVVASWRVVSDTTRDDVPSALHAAVPEAALLVTDVTSLEPETRSQLAQHVDVYVVVTPRGGPLTRMREPAVVVGVPDRPDSGHLLSVAGREAELRNRQLVVLHAQAQPVDVSGHQLERRWLDARGLAAEGDDAGARRPLTRVVVTRRPVSAALRDHVEVEDVLVVGVHPVGTEETSSLEASLLEAPPCDLLLTRTEADRAPGDEPVRPRWAVAPRLAVAPGPGPEA